MIPNDHPQSDADRAYAHTLRALLESGDVVLGGDSQSVGAKRRSQEVLNFAVRLEQPRERIIKNPARPLNLPGAVARFVWMMAGSDRLADIAFYEPKVAAFSDDGISVPGSSYGHRMLQPRPGLNQLVAVVERLRKDPSTRRAAIAIFHPEDAVRESKDIPCAFGVFYHVRGGKLYATTVMRSNNSFLLLPYNLFEFSLLAEVVAAELQLELGGLTHIAASMHLYEEDAAKARAVVDAASTMAAAGTVHRIPVMPPESPIDQVRALVKLEAKLRHESAGIGEDNIETWIQEAERVLNPYWRQHLYLLLVHVAKQNKSRGALDSLRGVLAPPWVDCLSTNYFEVTAGDSPALDLSFLELPDGGKARTISFYDTKMHRALVKRVEDWEGSNPPVGWRVFSALEKHFSSEIAARGDRDVIPDDEFVPVIHRLISGHQ